MIKEITFCDKCKKEIKPKSKTNNGITKFGEEYRIESSKRMKINGQGLKVLIKIEKSCGSDGELCDDCAGKIITKSLKDSVYFIE